VGLRSHTPMHRGGKGGGSLDWRCRRSCVQAVSFECVGATTALPMRRCASCATDGCDSYRFALVSDADGSVGGVAASSIISATNPSLALASPGCVCARA
jgi:hypothetical protein